MSNEQRISLAFEPAQLLRNIVLAAAAAYGWRRFNHPLPSPALRFTFPAYPRSPLAACSSMASAS